MNKTKTKRKNIFKTGSKRSAEILEKEDSVLSLEEIKREHCANTQFRSFDSRGHEVIDEDKRVLEFSLSSEYPVKRWFGMEILLHGKQNIDLERFLNKPAFLDMHDLHKQIGVIEKAWIEEKRLKIHVRFSKNKYADDIYRDIIDGIRTKVSVGYDINDLVLARTDDDDTNWYHAVSWSPYEGSSVSVGADDSVGFGRAREEQLVKKAEKIIIKEELKPIKEKRTMDPDELEKLKKDAYERAKQDMASSHLKNTENEQKRVADLLEIGKKFGKQDMANEFITTKKSADEMRIAVLETYHKKPEAFAESQTGDSLNLRLEGKDAKKYSLMRALNASMNKDWSGAGYEKEISDAIAQKQGRQAHGFFVPQLARFGAMAQTRAGQVAGTNADGGYLIGTDVRTQDYIDLLRDASHVIGLGAIQLRDLTGNVAIPRQITGNTTEAVAENAGATESKFTLDQVTLTPKIFTTNDSYSRQLLVQTSGDIEQLIVRSLLASMASKIDDQAISGSGSGNEAEGIRSTTGIGDVATATDGSAPTWPLMVAMETQVAIDNALNGNLSYLINSATNGKLKTTVKESGQAVYLKMGDEVNGYNAAITNKLPSTITKGSSGATLSTALFGNWADLIIGYWGGLDLLVDNLTNADTGKVRIVATQMADIGVRHPQSFCEMSGIITA